MERAKTFFILIMKIIEEIIFKGYTSEKLDKLKQEFKNREKMMSWKKLNNNEKNKDPLTKLLDLLKKWGVNHATIFAIGLSSFIEK